MKIKVGNYVRNKYGIAKVIDIEKNNGIDILVFDKPICFLVNKDTGEILKDKFTNRLPLVEEIDINRIKYGKLIELIEVGDIVNGHLVIDITQTPKKAIYIENASNKMAHIPYLNERIRTVITREQIKNMEYKVEN